MLVMSGCIARISIRRVIHSSQPTKHIEPLPELLPVDEAHTEPLPKNQETDLRSLTSHDLVESVSVSRSEPDSVDLHGVSQRIDGWIEGWMDVIETSEQN